MDAECAKESETSRFGEYLGASATRFGENVMKNNKIVMKIPAERGKTFQIIETSMNSADCPFTTTLATNVTGVQTP